MPTLPQPTDPTLEAADRRLEALQERRHSNRLGASQIGHECERALWYAFRWMTEIFFDAATLKRFRDGHDGEAEIIRRLQSVEGIEMPEEGKQHETTECDGHFVSRIDGVILGLLQAPKTYHTFEAKVTSEENLKKLEKAKEEVGEKDALKKWNSVYWAQAIIGTYLEGLTRHYLVAGSPGVRREVSVRTNNDTVEALKLLAKARRVIYATQPAERIGDATFFRCRMCDHAGLCHGNTFGLVHCRSCAYSTPIENAQWWCEKFNRILTIADQKAGCSEHLYLPAAVPGEQVDAADDFSWVAYKLRDGREWIDGTPPAAQSVENS